MLRVLPWITDGAVDFIDTFITERQKLGLATRVFEFGAGNSTLYFLSKGCFVRSIEHDSDWAERIRKTADAFDYTANLDLITAQRPYATQYQDDGFDLTIIDGRDRVNCLQYVMDNMRNLDQLIVLDNTERFDYKYKDMLPIIERNALRSIHFEQHQLEKDGKRYTTRTYARDRLEHRHITSICFKQGMYTTDGKKLLRGS
jgi:precorrin-6B methylase 2